MATNIAQGCDFVASTGGCDTVCVGNFCGVNEPPKEGRGSSNVLFVYMSDHSDEESTVEKVNDDACRLAWKIALPAEILVALVVAAALKFVQILKQKTATPTPTPPKRKDPDE